MKVKKIINKCHIYENIRILNNIGKLIWQGYVIDLKSGYPLDPDPYIILNSKVLGLEVRKKLIKNSFDYDVFLDIYISMGDKK